MEPVNFQKRSLEHLERDVSYALTQTKLVLQLLERLRLPVQGLSFLELGPGTDFGAQLILASLGAKVTLADRFLTKMDPSYHGELYRRLASAWDGPKCQLENAVEGGHEATSLRLLQERAEALKSVSDASIDIIYSNAVLEHVEDFRSVAIEAARITKAGGWGRHQIDMRDHRSFERPLSHLFMDEEEFQHAAKASNFEFGNRLRSMEFWAHFELAGFVVRERETNGEATDDYLAEILSRLRASGSIYRSWPKDDLRRICAAFYVQRAGGDEEALARSRASDSLSLISALKAEPVPARETEIAETVLDPASFVHESGHCWVAPLLEIGQESADEHLLDCGLRLLENDLPLGPAESLHSEIRSNGAGAYSRWGKQLYFSTSDNTSPEQNGRRYAVRYRRHRQEPPQMKGHGKPALLSEFFGRFRQT